MSSLCNGSTMYRHQKLLAFPRGTSGSCWLCCSTSRTEQGLGGTVPTRHWYSQKPSCPHTVLPHSRVGTGCSFALTYRSASSSPKTFLSQTRVIPVSRVLLSHLQILWTLIHRENIYLVFPNLISTPAKSPHPFQVLLMPMKIPLYDFGPFCQLKNVLDWAALALLPAMTAYSNVC